jgi:hypothetical protein
MNEAEKERLIKKDIRSIENRVRSAFNQGYEMGIKESRSEIPNTCGDAVSRQTVLDIIAFEDKWLFDANGHNANAHIAFSGLESRVKALPSVTPQQRTGRWIDAEVLDKIRAEIEGVIQEETVLVHPEARNGYESVVLKLDPDDVFQIIDKYKAESEEKE